jgi:hypothetical protein
MGCPFSPYFGIDRLALDLLDVYGFGQQEAKR